MDSHYCIVPCQNAAAKMVGRRVISQLLPSWSGLPCSLRFSSFPTHNHHSPNLFQAALQRRNFCTMTRKPGGLPGFKSGDWICNRRVAAWNCIPLHRGWSCMDMASMPEPRQAEITRINAQTQNIPEYFTEESLRLRPLSKQLISYFEDRGISVSTLSRNGVRECTSSAEEAIAFPFKKDGRIVNCKFRTLGKKFWQTKDREKIFYGLDDIKDASEVIIVEGEIDKLSVEEAGFLNCVSVPDGAPARVSEKKIPPEEDKKFGYVYKFIDYFEKVERIILATDADPPGNFLAEELARRLGRERCWRVKWPSNEFKKCKDANDVLQIFGRKRLHEVIARPEPYPIRGLFQFTAFYKELDDYFYRRIGNELGLSTGWDGLDKFYRIVPGEVTLLTGVPNSGKSEWIDALICNLNRDAGWKFALCSMENKVREHARKLLEKYLKKPFFNARYANSVPRMREEELDAGKMWLNENFFLIRCNDDELPSITWVLDLAKSAVKRYGIRGLVIDPYNELDHQRSHHLTETEYVSQLLTKVKRFAQHHDCHIWFVAHPKQLQFWQGDAPNLYDISGSAHFINKCDNGIVIHRIKDPNNRSIDKVQVLVRKVRNKAAGTMGDVLLTYDRATGQYHDCESELSSSK